MNKSLFSFFHFYYLLRNTTLDTSSFKYYILHIYYIIFKARINLNEFVYLKVHFSALKNKDIVYKKDISVALELYCSLVNVHTFQKARSTFWRVSFSR